MSDALAADGQVDPLPAWLHEAVAAPWRERHACCRVASTRRAVYEMPFVALQPLRERHARPDDWRSKERNVRSSLAHARGLTGEIAGAIELFATLGLEDDDWIGRDFAACGLLETCRALPGDDARRADLLQRARAPWGAAIDAGASRVAARPGTTAS